MKILILILSLLTFINANQYTFLIKEYDKEIELEAKIISNIANSSIKDEIILYIPNISKIEKKIYSKYFILSNSCENSNFVFVKQMIKEDELCSINKKLFFTNNYKKLLSNDRYFGAFFWNKSRPNIVFIKDRLIQNKINLPNTYEQFIEDF